MCNLVLSYLLYHIVEKWPSALFAFSHHSTCQPPQLWSTTIEKYYRGAQVTEGAKLKLLLFGQKWDQHHLSELVTSQLPCTNPCTGAHIARTGDGVWLHLVIYKKKRTGKSQPWSQKCVNDFTQFDGNNCHSET